MTADPITSALDLSPHPEGGAFRQTWAAAETVLVGVDLDAGQVPQAVVPAGAWQRTVPAAEDALVSCVVSPGFDFGDFEIAE